MALPGDRSSRGNPKILQDHSGRIHTLRFRAINLNSCCRPCSWSPRRTSRRLSWLWWTRRCPGCSAASRTSSYASLCGAYSSTASTSTAPRALSTRAQSVSHSSRTPGLSRSSATTSTSSPSSALLVRVPFHLFSVKAAHPQCCIHDIDLGSRVSHFL